MSFETTLINKIYSTQNTGWQQIPQVYPQILVLILHLIIGLENFPRIPADFAIKISFALFLQKFLRNFQLFYLPFLLWLLL